MTLLDLEIFAEEQGVEICDVPFRDSISMAFPEGWIAIDAAKIETVMKLREIIAHELGHCMTGAFYNIYSKFDIRSKHEQTASRWAYRRLVPPDKLVDAVSNGMADTWELAEHFGVSCDFMSEALNYYRNISGEI